MRHAMVSGAALVPLLALSVLLGSCEKDAAPAKPERTVEQATIVAAAAKVLQDGVALVQAGQTDKGLAKIRGALRALEMTPDTDELQAVAHRLIGAALLLQGKKDDGVKEFRKALALFATVKGTEKEQAQCRHIIEGFGYNTAGPSLAKRPTLSELEELAERVEQAEKSLNSGQPGRALEQFRSVLGSLEKMPDSQAPQAECLP